MNIISSTGDKNIAELARHVFEIKGARSGAAEKAAVAALMNANPGLAKDKSIPPGTPVIIPPVEHAGVSSAAASNSPPETASTLLQFKAALADANREIVVALESRTRADEEMLVSFKENARELSAAGDEVMEKFKAIQDAAKTRAKESAELAKLADADIAAISSEIEAFLKKFGIGG
jgi:hypothetical protein